MSLAIGLPNNVGIGYPSCLKDLPLHLSHSAMNSEPDGEEYVTRYSDQSIQE